MNVVFLKCGHISNLGMYPFTRRIYSVWRQETVWCGYLSYSLNFCAHFDGFYSRIDQNVTKFNHKRCQLISANMVLLSKIKPVNVFQCAIHLYFEKRVLILSESTIFQITWIVRSWRGRLGRKMNPLAGIATLMVLLGIAVQFSLHRHDDNSCLAVSWPNVYLGLKKAMSGSTSEAGPC